MKKIVNIVGIFLVLFFCFFSIESYAVSLSNIEVSLDKQTVHPGEEVKVEIKFGESLGSYNFYLAYDNNLLEYVSGEGGTITDQGNKVQVLFYDSEGGKNPRESLFVIFRAKEGITTSNPSDISVTADGLGSPDASTNYDDITTPIKKELMVEPKYEDYQIQLQYTGEIQENIEKNMKIVISSSMGKNYEHTRILAEAVTPENETVKLLATDESDLEYDIIQSGWGDIQGDAIGGKNVQKEIQTRGIFSGAGEYQITLKLIDRDNSDTEIVAETFRVTVGTENSGSSEEIVPPKEEEDESQQTGSEQEESSPNTTVEDDTTKTPTSLPKTGNTIYTSLFILFSILGIGTFFYQKKNNKNS